MFPGQSPAIFLAIFSLVILVSKITYLLDAKMNQKFVSIFLGHLFLCTRGEQLYQTAFASFRQVLCSNCDTDFQAKKQRIIASGDVGA